MKLRFIGFNISNGTKHVFRLYIYTFTQIFTFPVVFLTVFRFTLEMFYNSNNAPCNVRVTYLDILQQPNFCLHLHSLQKLFQNQLNKVIQVQAFLSHVSQFALIDPDMVIFLTFQSSVLQIKFVLKLLLHTLLSAIIEV